MHQFDIAQVNLFAAGNDGRQEKISPALKDSLRCTQKIRFRKFRIGKIHIVITVDLNINITRNRHFTLLLI